MEEEMVPRLLPPTTANYRLLPRGTTATTTAKQLPVVPDPSRSLPLTPLTSAHLS
jgi:hypothetical protein